MTDTVSKMQQASLQQSPSKAGGGTATIMKTETEAGYHSYSQEEKMAIVEHINDLLEEDEDLKQRIPMDSASDAIFEEVKDGLLIW